ncbi:DNA-directed DNA polymerase [Melia azedarach]|uniref:DNA-directed DNA polymerase n=1 Tax=Melia azedarach TaxID=155640 RepID=A0ACC1XBL7_MELAZ|nr:DNA-directed DNA polymerase [Melia azedarach]
MRRTRSLELVAFDPKIERTLHHLRRERRNRATNMAEERDQNPLPPQPQQQPRALCDYFRSVVSDNYSGIRRQAINANNFELKPALINMVQQNQYGGLSHEDPNIHLAMFLEVCDTVMMNGVDQYLIRMRLFTLSLRDKARAKEAYDLLKEMACSNYQWPSKRSIGMRAARVHEVDQMAALSAQVAALLNQIKNFTTREASSSKDKAMAASSSCVDDGFEQEQCQYINNRNYNFRPSNNLPTHYHPRLLNHENFSYGNASNAMLPPQPTGFQQQPMVKKKPSLEDLLSIFIVETRNQFNKNKARLDNIETHMVNIGATVKSLESGKELEPLKCKENEVKENKMKESDVIGKKVEEEALKEVSKPHGISFSDNPPIITPPLPFPQRFQKKKLGTQFSKFLEMFRKLHFNIPFADAFE